MMLFAGPAHVGQSYTYRVTGTLSTQATPKVSTLILTWTAPTRLYARLSDSGAATAVSITRDSDGALSVDPASTNNAGAAEVASLLNQLNFPGAVAARLNGSEHAQTTLSIAPPVASPSPVSVPVNIDLVNSSESATLIADGSSTNRNSPSDSGYGQRGGGMGGGHMGGGWNGGGWHSRDPEQNGNGESTQMPPVGFALAAAFDPSGSLEHATFRETFASKTKGAQPIEETFTIDRIDVIRQSG
jgi:hypothetical protein